MLLTDAWASYYLYNVSTTVASLVIIKLDCLPTPQSGYGRITGSNIWTKDLAYI